jgi:hypothetical protein
MATILYKTDDLTNFRWLSDFIGPKDDVDRFLLMDSSDGRKLVLVDLDHQLFDEWQPELDQLLYGPVAPGTIVHTYKELDPVDLFRLRAKGVVIVKSVVDVLDKVRARKFPPAEMRAAWRLAA